MTTAGWTAANPSDDPAGAALWAGVLERQQTRVCGDFQVQLSAGEPATDGYAFVGYTAHRVVNSPNNAAVVESLSGARLLIRQADGRWLVDVPVQGG